MKYSLVLVGLGLSLFFMACKEQPKANQNVKNEVAESNTVLVPQNWIDARVAKAKERLQATDAGKVIWSAMEAHGGLNKWYANGPLSFRFDYKPLDGSTQRDSYQTIDTWNNRAKHTSATDKNAHYGWTGETAWVQAKDSTAFTYDTRFWALTPIYFFGQPFILDGEGVNLELLPQKIYKDVNHDVVKVTFAQGTGDAPDDYYILYFAEDSHQLIVIRYIVSYPKYFKDGGHAPEKFMDVIGSQVVDGITFPQSYKTHWLNQDEEPGEYITQIDVSDVHFEPALEKGFFEVPTDAKVLDDE